VVKPSAQPGPRYEARDIHFPLLAAFIVAIFAFLGFTLLLASWIDGSLMNINRGNEPAPPMARLRRTPPEPRLQVSEAFDMVRLRDIEDVALSTYGWLDPEAGTVHIPIERAIEVLAAEGLPARQGASGRPPSAAHDPVAVNAPLHAADEKAKNRPGGGR
jgi:hypothetical protein